MEQEKIGKFILQLRKEKNMTQKELAEKLYYVYAWVVDGRYYLQNDEVKQDSGSSIPYVFVVEKIDEEYVVTDSRIPRDGSYYAKDMKNMFPLSVRYDMERTQIISLYYNDCLCTTVPQKLLITE